MCFMKGQVFDEGACACLAVGALVCLHVFKDTRGREMLGV